MDYKITQSWATPGMTRTSISSHPAQYSLKRPRGRPRKDNQSIGSAKYSPSTSTKNLSFISQGANSHSKPFKRPRGCLTIERIIDVSATNPNRQSIPYPHLNTDMTLSQAARFSWSLDPIPQNNSQSGAYGLNTYSQLSKDPQPTILAPVSLTTPPKLPIPIPPQSSPCSTPQLRIKETVPSQIRRQTSRPITRRGVLQESQIQTYPAHKLAVQGVNHNLVSAVKVPAADMIAQGGHEYTQREILEEQQRIRARMLSDKLGFGLEWMARLETAKWGESGFASEVMYMKKHVWGKKGTEGQEG